MLYKRILFTEQQVDSRITRMAADIVARYKGKDTIFVSLLNGAQPFAAKLMFAIQKHDPTFQPNLQSMIISRYGANRTPGPARVVTDLPPSYRDLHGRHIVLVDDLLDGGGTLTFAAQHLRQYGAAHIDNVVLIKKQKQPSATVDIAMFGFEAPDVWLTGMGMDDERVSPEGNRWAGWVAVASD